MNDDIKDMFDESDKGGEAPAKGSNGPAPRRRTAPARKPAPKMVTIRLNHNRDIPPGGLFLSHNGRAYKLRPGVEASVPEFLLDVLDNAVANRPVLDDNGSVRGYEEQPRFGYTIIRDKK